MVTVAAKGSSAVSVPAHSDGGGVSGDWRDRSVFDVGADERGARRANADGTEATEPGAAPARGTGPVRRAERGHEDVSERNLRRRPGRRPTAEVPPEASPQAGPRDPDVTWSRFEKLMAEDAAPGRNASPSRSGPTPPPSAPLAPPPIARRDDAPSRGRVWLWRIQGAVMTVLAATILFALAIHFDLLQRLGLPPLS